MNLMRFLKTAIVSVALMASAAVAQAEVWPSRPIKLVVPFGAGGTSDIAARVIADKLTARLGQPVIVENKPGVSGILGTEFVAKAPADGYTILLNSVGPAAFAPSTPKKLGYDSMQDFTHVAMVGSIPLVLVVNNDFAPRTVSDLVALGKAKPGVLNFGSSGPASPSHLMLERFKTKFQLDIAHIPFKGGSPATLTEIIGGRIDGTFDSLPALLTMIKAGKVRPIAVTSAQRHALLPNVPTMSEAGYSDLTAISWYSIAVPSGTPKEVVQRLNQELNAQLRTPEVKAKFSELAYTTSIMSTDEVRRFVADEIDRWRPVVHSSKITFQ